MCRRWKRSVLKQKEFDVLVALEEAGEALSQRQLAERTGYGVGTINKLVKTLSAIGHMENSRISEQGRAALGPYCVHRAVILAAGFGSRLVPVTLNTPKPLVRVHGTRIIDTLLDAIVAAGIEEIYIVRGYLAEQFDQLLYKYPMVKFVENPLYNETNNISSAMCVRELLGNSYVLEADLYLKKPELISKYQYSSNFLGSPVERTDDWCLVAKNNVIQSLQIGGMESEKDTTRIYLASGITYWTLEDGEKLMRHLEEGFNSPGGKELFWDQVPLTCYASHYQVRVRECHAEDIIEIDTFRELKAIDKSYDC